MLSKRVGDELAARRDAMPAGAIPHEAVVRYLVGGYMALLVWWLDGGVKLPPQHMDALFQKLAARGVSGAD
jgi:hypothetical protein